jgi:NADH dehydrogenase/NADH:ubiquinone oxidoreductase subunit G
MYDIAEPFGANIELNYRGLELMRILPRINYEINGE